VAFGIALVVGACGTGARSSTSTSASGGETTIPAAPDTVPIETVVAGIHAWLDDHFEVSEGVLGPYQLECRETGSVEIGDVLACVGTPQTEPDFPLDPVGVVIYVLDESGTAAWTYGTDVPDSTQGLAEIFEQTASDLSCDDLMSPDVAAGLFSGVGRPPEDAYFWSLVYWSLAGEPARMDAEGDGIPCEEIHALEVIAAVLDGGPLGVDDTS
jgi:hypothetical protein